MCGQKTVVTVGGRFFGVALLTVVQFIVGVIHMVFGFTMVSGTAPIAGYSVEWMTYSAYTWTFGCLTVLFTYLFWARNRLGWIGTAAVSLFVIVADTLTVFGLLNVLGIPAVAATLEIPFSILILVYLLQNHIRTEYNI